MKPSVVIDDINAALTEMQRGTGDGYSNAEEILRSIITELGMETGPEPESNGMKLGDRVTIDPAMRNAMVHYRVVTGDLTAITTTGNDPYDKLGTVKAGDVESHIPMLWLRKV